jgi:hypothetical protein
MNRPIDIKDRDCALAVIGVLRALQAKFESQSAYEEEREDDAANHRDSLAEEAHCAACEAWSEAALICEVEAINLEMTVRSIDCETSETMQ